MSFEHFSPDNSEIFMGALQIIAISDSDNACRAIAYSFTGYCDVVKVWSPWQISELPASAVGQLSVVLLDADCEFADEAFAVCSARANTYIIAISGSLDAQTLAHLSGSGAHDVIEKPATADALSTRVQFAAAKMSGSSRSRRSAADVANFRHSLHTQDMLVFVYDIGKRTFDIDPLAHTFIAGNFNSRPLEQILSEDSVLCAADIERARKYIYRIIHDKSAENIKLLFLTPSGEKRWFELSCPMRDLHYGHDNTVVGGTIFIAIRDIHRQILAEDNLRKRAERDALTGLYNRDTFFELAANIISRHPAGSYIMACFDIDGFKTINDQYGIAVGDEILKYFAECASPVAQNVGGLLARFTADNFAAIYPNRPEIVELVTNERSKIIEWGSTHLPLSHSVGRYVIDDPSLPVSAMYDRAFLAKASVKGRYDTHVAYYDESMRKQLLSEQAIMRDMVGALRTGQYEVHLQPQYDHSSGTLIGAEALVRWNHPERGMISPAEFIPIFERSGFIYTLDKYVWEQVCILIGKWREKGYVNLPVSVNISRYDILQSDFLDTILSLTQKHSTPHELLRLEITESAFSQSPERLIEMVKCLREHGFSVEIDDFGSGYSSLGTLKDVPADILKLDMRFFESGDDAQRGGNIINAVVRMAKWLRMPVIAEGVETVTQADFLSSIGCPYIQGYLYSKPVPISQYEEILSSAQFEAPMSSSEAIEQLNNDAFWDPQSMETVIFTSYVGGACLFEYSQENIEILRVNKKCLDTIRPGLTEAELISADIHDYLDAASRSAIKNAVLGAVDSQDEKSFELCIDAACAGSPVYLNATIRVIARTGQRYLFYCLLENITERILAQQKVLRTDRQLTLLNEISHDLLLSSDPIAAIEEALSKVLDYFDGERAFVYEFDWVSSTLSNTSEVCAPGCPSKIDRYQGVSLFAYSLWLKALENAKHIVIRNTAALDDSHTLEREALLRDGVNSLLIVPFYSEGRLMGFMGVDNPKANLSFVANLESLGDYLAVMLTRRDLGAALERERDSLRYIIDNTATGFLTLSVSAYSGMKPTFINERLVEMTGIAPDEIERRMSDDPYSGIHPEDRESVRAVFNESIITGQDISFRCRITRRDGGWIWVKAGGAVKHNIDGSTGIDLCIADISDEAEAMSSYTTLLDNLPIGAGIYELLEGGQPSMIYTNKKLSEYVGRTSDAYRGLKTVNTIHPDDHQTMRDAIREAMTSSKSLECILRIIHGEGYYLPFKLRGRIVEQNGKPYIYVTFSKLS